MKLIKPIIAALCLALGLNACANNKESKNQNKKGANMEIVHLTKTEFLNKVYNANGLLMNAAHTDRMDLSNMPKGIYIVKAGDAIRKLAIQ